MKRSGIALVLALVIPCAAFAQGGGEAEVVEAAAPADLPVEALAARRLLQAREVRLQHRRPLQGLQVLRTRV
jgi:hypothetical protein